MTVQEKRDKMLSDLAAIMEWQRNHEIISKERADNNETDHVEIKELLITQNGRVRTNTNKLSWIVGLGVGIAFILGLGIFAF